MVDPNGSIVGWFSWEASGQRQPCSRNCCRSPRLVALGLAGFAALANGNSDGSASACGQERGEVDRLDMRTW